MKFSKALLIVPAASILFGFAVAVGAGACGDDDAVTIPDASDPPMGVTFVGGEFGGKCNGNVYATAGTGWAFCDGDTWKYTTTDPSVDNFTPFSPDSDAGPPADGSVADGAQGDDATRIDETGPGDDGGQQGPSGDDGGQGRGLGGDGGQQ